MLGRAQNKIGKSGTTAASSRDYAPERQLVVAAKSGDPSAFDTLFKCHERRIFALALRYTRIREDAEDVVQETFQKAFVHFHNFEEKSSFSTWATRIAINQALMLLRRRRALSELPIDDSSTHEGATPALELPDAGPDPETTYVQKEEAQILSAAMSRLRPEMRRAIELRDLRELSNLEAAACLGVTPGTVKARAFRARKKLGETLRPYMRPHRNCDSDLLATTGNANRGPQFRMTFNA